jgi:hypothetical protein
MIETVSLFSKQIFNRYADIIEVQFGGVLRFHTDFFEIASAPEAFHLAVYDQQAQS